MGIVNKLKMSIADSVAIEQSQADVLNLLPVAEALEESKPPIEKEGQITKLVHSNGMLVWELVDDPNYVPVNDGTDYLKPITYIDGMAVTEGLWYTDGDDTWECIRTGEPSQWNTAWFDIIE